MDPPLPDQRRVLPGGYVLGDDNERIETAAQENRINVEMSSSVFPGYFVAVHEDFKGTNLGTYVIQAETMYEAILKVEKDLGRHMWLSNGNPDHQVGITRLVLTCNLLSLRRVRKENCFV